MIPKFSIINFCKITFESRYPKNLLKTSWDLYYLPPTPILMMILDSKDIPLLFPVTWE